jgi:hypothetical protein
VLFQRGSNRSFIIARPCWSTIPWTTVFHEYARQLMNGNLQTEFDPWFEDPNFADSYTMRAFAQSTSGASKRRWRPRESQSRSIRGMRTTLQSCQYLSGKPRASGSSSSSGASAVDLIHPEDTAGSQNSVEVQTASSAPRTQGPVGCSNLSSARSPRWIVPLNPQPSWPWLPDLEPRS